MAKYLGVNKTPRAFERDLNRKNILELPDAKYFSKEFLMKFAESEKALKRKFVNEYRKEFIKKSSIKT